MNFESVDLARNLATELLWITIPCVRYVTVNCVPRRSKPISIRNPLLMATALNGMIKIMIACVLDTK